MRGRRSGSPGEREPEGRRKKALRLLAWKLRLHKTGGKIKTQECFDCEVLCSQKGEWNDEQRARRGCSRVDLPPVPWDVDATLIHVGGWMGRHPISPDEVARLVARGPKIRIASKQPTEDPTEGCPGSWYRSLFIASLVPFLRRRDGNGGRVSNPMLDRTDDEVILQLAMLLESEQERWEANRAEKLADG